MKRKPEWESKRTRPSKLRDLVAHLQDVKTALEAESVRLMDQSRETAKEAIKQQVNRGR